jgi:alcohol dehydrogenase (cytochrome c)
MKILPSSFPRRRESSPLGMILGVVLLVAVSGVSAQQVEILDPTELLQPLGAEWNSYSGDYTGRRYSALTQVDKSNVQDLTLAWTARMNPAVRTQGALITQQGGEGTGEYRIPPPQLKGTFLQVGGVLYVTAPDQVWALDAHDGRELWHYFWKTKGGTHIANRGAALWRNSLLFETPDNYLVSLDARSGKENWHVEIASFEQQYFSTMAPIVIGDRVLVGTGNDLDSPGFLQAFSAETGELLWKHYTVPQNPGDPGLETWPNLQSAKFGGAQVWVPGVYDPETDYYIFGTGNPTPAYTGVARPGDNLFTCTLMAINVSTGEMAWYFQTSPHDTHDWDSAQTPILIDGVIDGQPRKLVSTAARNGYFFTVDRVTGEHIVTKQYGKTANWSLGVRPTGEPEPNPAKEATIPGSLVSPIEGGVTNWQAPAFNPDLGLFYVHENNGFNILYLTDPDPRGSMGLGGKRWAIVGSEAAAFNAIDYRTGEAQWRHEWPGGGGVGSGVLTTASGLVFTGDGNGNMVAFDGADGTILWHTRIGNLSNGPQTFMVDGRQYLTVGVGDMIYAFVMY